MSLNLKKAIRTYKPIEKLGLTFYPITMEHYEEFQVCKSVLTIRLGTLPIKYATMDYFTAIYSWDKDITNELPADTEFNWLKDGKPYKKTPFNEPWLKVGRDDIEGNAQFSCRVIFDETKIE